MAGRSSHIRSPDRAASDPHGCVPEATVEEWCAIGNTASSIKAITTAGGTTYDAAAIEGFLDSVNP